MQDLKGIEIETIVVEDGTNEAEEICRHSPTPVKYIVRSDRPDLPFSNPAVPYNRGIRASSGQILILKPAEVRFTRPTDIYNLIKPVLDNPKIVSFALCEALDAEDKFLEHYAGPARCAGWFLGFSMAVRREHVMTVQGFHEAFKHYGFEDDFFYTCIRGQGLECQWNHDVLVQHLYHAHHGWELSDEDRALYKRLHDAIETGQLAPIANQDNPAWGLG